MTLVEALVAIAILSGVMATAIDTFRFAATRSAVHQLEIEAATLAESLLARAGVDIPLKAQQDTAVDGSLLSWSVDSQQVGQAGRVQLIKIQSRVKIVRAGIAVEQNLSTQRLKQDPQK